MLMQFSFLRFGCCTTAERKPGETRHPGVHPTVPRSVMARSSAGVGRQSSAELGDLVLQFDDSLRARQRQALAHQRGQRGDVVEFGSAVPSLPTDRAGWTDNSLGVEPPNEGGLHVEQLGRLADREERGDVVGNGGRAVGPTAARRRRPAPAAHDTPAPTGSCDSSCDSSREMVSIDVGWSPPTAMSSRRGLACSFTGMRSRSTPSL